MGTALASFPNSRIKPRPATRVSDVTEVTIPAATTLQVRAADANRVRVSLFNSHPTIDVFYDYESAAQVNALTEPNLPANGNVDLDSKQAIFVRNPNATTAVKIMVDEGVA